MSDFTAPRSGRYRIGPHGNDSLPEGSTTAVTFDGDSWQAILPRTLTNLGAVPVIALWHNVDKPVVFAAHLSGDGIVTIQARMDSGGNPNPDRNPKASYWCEAPNPDGPLPCGRPRGHLGTHARGERRWDNAAGEPRDPSCPNCDCTGCDGCAKPFDWDADDPELYCRCGE